MWFFCLFRLRYQGPGRRICPRGMKRKNIARKERVKMVFSCLEHDLMSLHIFLKWIESIPVNLRLGATYFRQNLTPEYPKNLLEIYCLTLV